MTSFYKQEPLHVLKTAAPGENGLGLVFGWAMICQKNGQDYVDVQNDHITEDGMLGALTKFMGTARESRENHERAEAGQVLFAFPLTAEVQKSLGIQADRTGAIVGIWADAEMLAKAQSGELTGFSIGGSYGDNEAVEA